VFVLQGIEGKKLMGSVGGRDRDREAKKSKLWIGLQGEMWVYQGTSPCFMA